MVLLLVAALCSVADSAQPFPTLVIVADDASPSEKYVHYPFQPIFERKEKNNTNLCSPIDDAILASFIALSPASRAVVCQS